MVFLHYPPPTPKSHNKQAQRKVGWAETEHSATEDGCEAGREEEHLRAPRVEPRPGAGRAGEAQRSCKLWESRERGEVCPSG